MRNTIFVTLAITLNFFGYTQNIKMNGSVINSETKEPIKFVNIGILKKNKGTISNENGEFNLNISRKFLNDSLTISHINYYPIKVPIENLKNKPILLTPKTNELSEIIVSNKKIKHRKIGVKSFNRFLSMRVISETNDIIEVAQRVNISNKEVRIKVVNFNIRKWSKVDGVYVRINFYKNEDNAPGEKIIMKNIIKEIPKKTDSNWMQINLDAYHINISQNFFVGIEFIPNFKNPTILDLGAILTKGKGYSRTNSLGIWKKLNGGAAINVEVKY